MASQVVSNACSDDAALFSAAVLLHTAVTFVMAMSSGAILIVLVRYMTVLSSVASVKIGLYRVEGMC
jgi:hypothetical protein